MGQSKFSLLISKNGKSQTKTYKCDSNKKRWAKYYIERGFKVSS